MRGFILITILLTSSCVNETLLLEKRNQGTPATSAGASSSALDASTLGAAPADEEWIVVPANAGGMGLDAFAVMKYEAKAFNDANTNSTIDGGEVDAVGTAVETGTHVPVSTADNQPWRNIDANDSAMECESLGANYHLISNPEWMAIAREVEMQDANWTGGTEGSGCLFRGNSGEITVGTGTLVTDSCGYNATTDPEQGSGRDLRAKHVLSNAEEIYDLSGNLYEWTDWDGDTVGFQVAPHTATCGFGNELPATVACGTLADADYNTNNGGYESTEGVGYFIPDFFAYGGAALRGSSWINKAYAGAFALDLSNSPTSANTLFGFRCVYRP
jgi:formylglycine-generating enzyme required for sulfatase activity